MQKFVDSDPYPWPFNGGLEPGNTVFIIIDMQTDFCGPGGYVDKMGYDLSLTRAPIGPIRDVLTVARKRNFHVMHTREGHRPDLADLPELLKSSMKLHFVDKPGKGSFYATDLDMVLRQRGIRNIVLAGITTDVCVHTTMREANDRGYECLLLSDCTGATDLGNHLAALKMVKMQGGVFGAVADSRSFIEALA